MDQTEKNIGKPLSDKEVLRLVNGKANLILYPQLHKYKSIDEILGPYDATFILFESEPRFGHWCCLFKEGNDVEFFNPYGGYPDDSLKYIDKNFRKISNQLIPYLSYLMLDSPYELFYNEHKFQKMEEGVNTCGRWCAVRLLCRDISLDDFAKYFRGKDGDYIVTEITSKKI